MLRKIIAYALWLAAIAAVVVAVVVAVDRLNCTGDHIAAAGIMAEGILGALVCGFFGEALA